MDEITQQVARWRELQVRRLELEAAIKGLVYPEAGEPGYTRYVPHTPELEEQVKPFRDELWEIADEQDRIVYALGEWMVQNHE